MTDAPDTLPAPPPSEPPPAVTIRARPIGRTAADERIDGLLDRIEPLLQRIPVALEDSARQAERMRSAFGDLTAEVSRYNGKQSDLETKIDALSLLIEKQVEYFEANKGVFELVKELRAAFPRLWSHLQSIAEGSAVSAQEHVASVHPLRGTDP
jgi:hypothetical protein